MSIPPPLSSAFPVVRDGERLPPRLKGAVVAIGNFDGVHRGHRAVIDAAAARAREMKRAALALTFEPHPRSFFKPNVPLFRLTPEPAKLKLLAATGLEGAVVMRFDQKLAGLSAEAFVAEILVGPLAIGGVAVGADFHFGKGRLGTPSLLRDEGARRGFKVELVAQRMADGKPISSGAIRAALTEGKVTEASALLGHSWFVEGEVIKGAERGRALGFPTANLQLDPAATLKHGIYAVRAHLDGKSHDAVASFGRRPQFDDGAPLLEVYLFDFAGELYGRTLAVEFVDFIRPEAKFESVEALTKQMKRDSEQAMAILGRIGKA
jgi:riboflavin kinase/FMN adenylyltransferase